MKEAKLCNNDRLRLIMIEQNGCNCIFVVSDENVNGN